MRWFLFGSMMMASMWYVAIGCSPANNTTEQPTENALPDASTEVTPDTTTIQDITTADTTTQDTSIIQDITTADNGASGAIPTNGADLKKYLEAGNYKSWTKESAVHDATQGSPHGPVLVFINDTLEQSLKAGNTEHPVGSASVKELYESDKTTVKGYAVMAKVKAGTGGDTWYWYEIISGNVVADGVGSGTCTSCHTPGKDYFRTTYPLQ